jgi:hypothetical protein
LIKLFLDIDGVLLGKREGQISLSAGATEFLNFVVDHFDCFWLTTHCQGEIAGPLERLRPYVDPELMTLLQRIKPTRFNVLKTEALPHVGGFLWIEDSPLAAELAYLQRNQLLSCWLHVDTYRREDDLVTCLAVLKNR